MVYSHTAIAAQLVSLISKETGAEAGKGEEERDWEDPVITESILFPYWSQGASLRLKKLTLAAVTCA